MGVPKGSAIQWRCAFWTAAVLIIIDLCIRLVTVCRGRSARHIENESQNEDSVAEQQSRRHHVQRMTFRRGRQGKVRQCDLEDSSQSVENAFIRMSNARLPSM